MENIKSVYTVNGCRVKKWKVNKVGRKYMWLEGGKRINTPMGTVEEQIDNRWYQATAQYYGNKEEAMQAAFKNKLHTHIAGAINAGYATSSFLHSLGIPALEAIYIDLQSRREHLMSLDNLKRLHEDLNNV